MGETMIERIALALQEHRMRLPGAGGLQGELRISSGTAKELAKTALLAMCEPTEAMIRAAGDGPADRSCWQRIIDAALSEANYMTGVIGGLNQ